MYFVEGSPTSELRHSSRHPSDDETNSVPSRSYNVLRAARNLFTLFYIEKLVEYSMYSICFHVRVPPERHR
jgi:hypothetical protein